MRHHGAGIEQEETEITESRTACWSAASSPSVPSVLSCSPPALPPSISAFCFPTFCFPFFRLCEQWHNHAVLCRRKCYRTYELCAWFGWGGCCRLLISLSCLAVSRSWSRFIASLARINASRSRIRQLPKGNSNSTLCSKTRSKSPTPRTSPRQSTMPKSVLR